MRLLKKKGLFGIGIGVLVVFGFIGLRILSKAEHDGDSNAARNKVQKRKTHGTHQGNSAIHLNITKGSTDKEKVLNDWSVKLESYCGESVVDKGVTHEDQRAVVELFNKLESSQQLEEIQHAMNMLPDRTVQVVYGILFDSTQSKEVVDVIFSDVLNRDDAIKNPVMEEIVKDKKHPMYFESARILDVMGLLSKEE